jgi:hypothetical protein
VLIICCLNFGVQTINPKLIQDDQLPKLTQVLKDSTYDGIKWFELNSAIPAIRSLAQARQIWLTPQFYIVASYVAEGNKEFAQRELLVLQQLIDEDPHERADFIKAWPARLASAIDTLK